MHEVLRKQGTGEARGIDGWGPKQLAARPDALLGALRAMTEEWEAQGVWPEALRQVLFSMIPKPNRDETETSLRPIGLLP